MEFDYSGFNLVSFKKAKKPKKGEVPEPPTRLQLNPLVPIRCLQCGSGLGADYEFFVAKKPKGAKEVFIEALRSGGLIDLFGPATAVK